MNKNHKMIIFLKHEKMEDDKMKIVKNEKMIFLPFLIATPILETQYVLAFDKTKMLLLENF